MDNPGEYAPSEEENSTADSVDDLLSEELSSEPSPPEALSTGPGSSRVSEENTGTKKSDSKNRKRRENRVEESKARAKRRRRNCSDGYRVLLNEVISEATDGVNLFEEELLKPSQIGLTGWSAKEKQAFFAVLDRKGKLDFQSIAAAVQTKSESEVHVYAQLLHQGTIEHHLHHRHHELVGQADLSAAIEIGRECELALDQDAYGLSVKQFNHEAKLEERKYGELWLLDLDTAVYLKEDFMNDDGVIAKHAQIHSAVELLDLTNFLGLSERVFMNSSNLRDNWRSYAENGEPPSIFCTAFLDFHTLAVSITKRLVQSALYFAMSRLRATDTSTYTYGRMVRKEDVTAALDVLGMKPNSRGYWAEAARRCNLHVYERFTRSGRPKGKLSYSETERRVRQATWSEDGSVSSSSKDEEETNSSEDHAAPLSKIKVSNQEESEPSPAPSTDSSSLLDDIDLIPIRSARAKRQLRSSKKIAKLHDAYAEALDRQASQKEEQRLWDILGKQQPIKPEDIELPPRPITERKLKDDLVDWRDWIDYRSPWERYETPILAESFRRNRRIGRKSRTVSRERAQEDGRGATGDDEDEGDADSSEAETSSDEEDEHDEHEGNDSNDNDDYQPQDHNSPTTPGNETDSPPVQTNDKIPAYNKKPPKHKN